MDTELEFLVEIEAVCAKYQADIHFSVGAFSFSLEEHVKQELAKIEKPLSNVVQLHPQ